MSGTVRVRDVRITRALLAADDLELNDRIRYRLALIRPGRQQWRRQTVSSPFVDGEFTTHRSRAVRELQVAVDINGSTWDVVNERIGVLLDAFEQDTFEFTFTLDDQVLTFQGEAADHEVDLERERLHAKRPQMLFTFPAQPILLSGRL